MKRLLPVAVAFAALALPLPAEARVPDPGTTYVTASDSGGCRLDGTLEGAATLDAYVTGVIVTTVQPDSAWCALRVDGTDIRTYAAAIDGPIATVNAHDRVPGVSEDDVIQICTVLQYGPTPVESCSGVASSLQVPPQEVVDLLDTLLAGFVDPLLCPVLRTVAPVVVNTLLVVDTQGDVYVNGALFYDCPPYTP